MGRIARKVVLSEEEKIGLTSIIEKCTHKSRKIIRGRALLLLDSGKDRSIIQAELGIDVNHYYHIKKRFFEGGLTMAMEELSRDRKSVV